MATAEPMQVRRKRGDHYTLGAPRVILQDGAVVQYGLSVNAANATIRYLSVWGFQDNIYLASDAADNVLIDSNIIGAKYAREQCERMGWMFKPN